MNMKKFVSVAVITILALGLSGCSWFQSNETETDEPTVTDEPETTTPEKLVLFKDEANNVQFTTTDEECNEYYEVKAYNEMEDANGNSVPGYAVYVPGSEQWDADNAYYYYGVYTQTQYDQFDADELPGSPQIVLVLNRGINKNETNLLTYRSPQDGPSDQPQNCKVTPETIE